MKYGNAADDDLVQALGDALGDPASRLLDVDWSRSRSALCEPEPILSGREAFLEAAERHLIDAYREQVAWLLRRAALWFLYTSPRAAGALHTSKTATEEVDVPDERALAREASHWRGGSVTEPSARAALELLLSSLRRSRHPRSTTELAVASLRLAPSDVARGLIQVDLTLRGEHGAAQRAAANILADHPQSQRRSEVHENLGLMHYRGGDPRRAWKEYRLAARCAPERVSPVVFWFTSALLAGDEAAMTDAAERIEERLPEDHLLYDWLSGSLAAAPLPAEGFVDKWRNDPRWPIRRILHAFDRD